MPNLDINQLTQNIIWAFSTFGIIIGALIAYLRFLRNTRLETLNAAEIKQKQEDINKEYDLIKTEFIKLRNKISLFENQLNSPVSSIKMENLERRFDDLKAEIERLKEKMERLTELMIKHVSDE